MALGVALDDAHYTVNSYLESPANSTDLSGIISCEDASNSLKLVNSLRAATHFALDGANAKMIEIDPFEQLKSETANVRLMNTMFKPTLTRDLCTLQSASKESGRKHDQNKFTARKKGEFISFESTICDFYRLNSSSVDEYTYVKTDEPGYTNTSTGYYLDTNVFEFESMYTRCGIAASTSGSSTMVAKMCYLVPASNISWIPHDVYDISKRNVDIVKELIGALPRAHSLITCEYLLKEKTNDGKHSIGLRKTEEKLKMAVKMAVLMWGGMLTTAICFFSMWIILMIALQRLRNEELMIDSSQFDPEKAGYEY